MEQIRIKLKNEPGELARVCDLLGKNGININSILGGGLNDEGFVNLITSDPRTTDKAFRKGGYEPSSKEILTVKLPDRPGELCKVTERLARARINVNWIYLLTREKGEATLALDVDKLEEAKKVLK